MLRMVEEFIEHPRLFLGGDPALRVGLAAVIPPRLLDELLERHGRWRRRYFSSLRRLRLWQPGERSFDADRDGQGGWPGHEGEVGRHDRLIPGESPDGSIGQID